MESTPAQTHLKILDFMTRTAKRLQMKSVPFATAAYIYHKFFSHFSLEEYDPHTIATSAIYLAAKVCEQHIRLRDVINCSHKTLLPNDPPIESEEEYQQVRDSICKCEMMLMRALKFKIGFELPHKYVLHYLASLRGWLAPDVWLQAPLADTCWALLHDCCWSAPVLLRYPPEHTAAAVLYLALELCRVATPQEAGEDGPSWWQALNDDLSEERLKTIALDLMQIYDTADSSCPPPAVALEAAGDASMTLAS